MKVKIALMYFLVCSVVSWYFADICLGTKRNLIMSSTIYRFRKILHEQEDTLQGDQFLL